MGSKPASRTGYTCVRHTLCVINLLFWILGCGILGVGLWLRFGHQGYGTLFPAYQILSADQICIATGALVFLVAFLGCCGSWFQSKCLLGAYFALVVLIFILEFIVGTLGFVYRKEVGELLQRELKAGLQDDYQPNGSIAETWDQIQQAFSCCGVYGHGDWYQIPAWPDEARVPVSCCLPEYQFALNDTCATSGDSTQWHNWGCYRKLHMWLMERLYVVGMVCMAFAFIQLFGLIAALLVVCTRNEKRRRR